MIHSKKCAICGTEYEYCNTCKKYSNMPSWKFLFHDENCKLIYEAVNDYKANVIDAETAKERLSKLDLSISLLPGTKKKVGEIMSSGIIVNEDEKQEVKQMEQKYERQNFQRDKYKNFKKEHKQ